MTTLSELDKDRRDEFYSLMLGELKQIDCLSSEEKRGSSEVKEEDLFVFLLGQLAMYKMRNDRKGFDSVKTLFNRCSNLMRMFLQRLFWEAVDAFECEWFLDSRPFGRDEKVHKRTYFVRSGATGNIKIGSSHDPLSRIMSLQIGNSDRLVLLGVIDSKEVSENQAHKMFWKYHVTGEWFKPDPELLMFIETRATKLFQFRRGTQEGG